MASNYSTGSVTSFPDLLGALSTFLVANGWTLTTGTGTNRIYAKAGTVVRFYTIATVGAAGLYLIGATGISGAATTGDASAAVKIGSNAPTLVNFPATYEFAINDTPDEVYINLQYGGNKVQHLHFGKSDIPDIGGTGGWFGGSMSVAAVIPRVFTQFSDISVATGFSGIGHGYFMSQVSSGLSFTFVHCGLEGADAWRVTGSGGPTTGQLIGVEYIAGLLRSLPSNFNESEVLLPIYGSMVRTDGTHTIVVALRHARYLRIDNVTPGDLITYGPDRWKVHPLYAKSSAQRNGVPWDGSNSPTSGAEHSGTLGIALRYYGV